MRTQLLIPGMEHERQSDLTSQFTTPELHNGSRRRVKVQFEQLALIGFTCQHPRVEFVRQREHLVKIRDRQQFQLTRFPPSFLGPSLALGAMSISATVVNESLKVAISTLQAVTTKRRCSTVNDRVDHFELSSRNPMSIQKVIAVTSKDIGQFESPVPFHRSR